MLIQEAMWTTSVADDRKWLAESEWDDFEEVGDNGEGGIRDEEGEGAAMSGVGLGAAAAAAAAAAAESKCSSDAVSRSNHSSVAAEERVVATAQVCAYELMEESDESWRELARGEWMMLYLVEQESTQSMRTLRLAAVDPATGELAIASPVGPDAELAFADAEGEPSESATTFGELSCGTLDARELPLFGVRFSDADRACQFAEALLGATKLLDARVESKDEAKATLVALGFDEQSIAQAFEALGESTADHLANWIIEQQTDDDDFGDVTFTQEAVDLAAWSLVRQAAIDDDAEAATKLARQLVFDGDKSRDKFWAWVAQRASSKSTPQAAYLSILSDVERRVEVKELPATPPPQDYETTPPAGGVKAAEEKQQEGSSSTVDEDEEDDVLTALPPPRQQPAPSSGEIEERRQAAPPPPPPPFRTPPEPPSDEEQRAKPSSNSSTVRFKSLTNAVSRIRLFRSGKKKKAAAGAEDQFVAASTIEERQDPMELVERAMRRASGAPHVSGRGEMSTQPFQPTDFDAVRVLGRGSFGVVALAKRRSDGQIFAIKVLKKQRLVRQRAEAMARLERDVLDQLSAGRSTRHAFIARMRFAFQSFAKLFIGMDYYPNGSLHSVLQKDSQSRRHGRRAAKAVAAQLACALEHVHKSCVIHRDVKPSNVLVDARGHVALSDFGLATRVHSRGGDLRKRSFVGTIDYAAPELLLKSSTRYNHVVDCWALGCLVFEMCAGQPPFHAPTTRDTFARIVRAEPRWRSIINIAESTRTTLELLLQKDPRVRLGAQSTFKHEKTDWFDLSSNADALAQQPPPLEAFLRDAKIRQPDVRSVDPEVAKLFNDDYDAQDYGMRLRNRSDAFGGYGRAPSIAPPQQQQHQGYVAPGSFSALSSQSSRYQDDTSRTVHV